MVASDENWIDLLWEFERHPADGHGLQHGLQHGLLHSRFLSYVTWTSDAP